jgi:hypothetical protein
MKPSFEKLFPPEGSSIRCFNRAEMEKPVNWHYHPEVELTLVEKGTGTRFVGDNIDNYRDGDLVLLGSNLPHHWSSDEFRGQKYDRHPAVVVQFHRELFGPMLRTPELVEIRELLSRAERGLHVRGRSREIVATTMLQMLHLAPFDRLLRLMRCLQILATTDDLVERRLLALLLPEVARTIAPRVRLHQRESHQPGALASRGGRTRQHHPRGVLPFLPKGD